MNSFPFMKRIEGKKCLLVGGGNVALRKAEKLIPFGPELTVCAEALHEEFLKLPVRVFRRGYDRSLLKDMDLSLPRRMIGRSMRRFRKTAGSAESR